MKRFFLPVLISAALALSCGGNTPGDDVVPGKDDPKDPVTEFKEEPDDPAADPKGIFDYSVLMSQPHPRLLINDDDWKTLREHAVTNPTLKKFNDIMLAYAESVVVAGNTLTYKITDGYLVYVAWEAAVRIMYCSYAYKMTGEEKFLKKLEKDLQSVCIFPDWYPEHYLGTADLAMCTAIAYDWCYYDLSLTTRKMVRKALNDLAFATYEDAKVTKRTNNWYPVCMNGLTLAAIATYEKNKAVSAKVIDDAVKFNPAALKASYAPEGVYPEGYNYWGYGTMAQASLLSALKKCFGSDNGLSASQGWDRTGDFILYMVGMNGQSFNYSDCGPGLSPKFPMWYFAYTLNRPELVTTEVRMLDEGLYTASAEWRYMPLGMMWVDGVDCTNLKFPEAKVWSAGGETGEVPVCMVHTDWTWSETDKYLAFKGGKSDAPHGHMDSGSFVYDAFGQRWADDIGPEEYAPLEDLFASWGGKFFAYDKNSYRWTCFRLNAFSHNTITVNNDTHNPNGIATITKVCYDEEPEGYGADLNMTPPLNEHVASATRKFRLKGDVLTIADSFVSKGNEDAVISWHMATTASATMDGDRVKLEKGGKTVYLSVSGTQAATLRVYPAEGDREDPRAGYDYDTPNPGYTMVGWESTVAKGGRSASFTTTIQP